MAFPKPLAVKVPGLQTLPAPRLPTPLAADNIVTPPGGGDGGGGGGDDPTVVRTTGSYPDPDWIPSLSGEKVSGPVPAAATVPASGVQPGVAPISISGRAAVATTADDVTAPSVARWGAGLVPGRVPFVDLDGDLTDTASLEWDGVYLSAPAMAPGYLNLGGGDVDNVANFSASNIAAGFAAIDSLVPWSGSMLGMSAPATILAQIDGDDAMQLNAASITTYKPLVAYQQIQASAGLYLDGNDITGVNAMELNGTIAAGGGVYGLAFLLHDDTGFYEQDGNIVFGGAEDPGGWRWRDWSGFHVFDLPSSFDNYGYPTARLRMPLMTYGLTFPSPMEADSEGTLDESDLAQINGRSVITRRRNRGHLVICSQVDQATLFCSEDPHDNWLNAMIGDTSTWPGEGSDSLSPYGALYVARVRSRDAGEPLLIEDAFGDGGALEMLTRTGAPAAPASPGARIYLRRINNPLGGPTKRTQIVAVFQNGEEAVIAEQPSWA